MEKETEVEVIRTSDLLVAAYLVYKGFRFIKPPYLNKKGFVVYTFERTSELEDAWCQFDTRSDLVEPLSILERYRELRAQSWEMRKRSIEVGFFGGDDNE